MNGNFFSNPTFPTNNSPAVIDSPPANISYSYPDSTEWRDKTYEGIIEEAGKDHLIMSDPKTGNWWFLRMIYLNYVIFEERINYNHDYSEKTF